MENTGAQRALENPPVLQMMVMRIVTRFTTPEQFITGFSRLCTETTCFIPTTDGRTIGVEIGFSIRLADGTLMLRGLCVVLDVWTTAESPYERAGVLLGIRRMTAESIGVFHQLQMMRSAVPTELPQDETVPHTPPAEVTEEAFATTQMSPLFPDGDCTTYDDDDVSAIPTEALEDQPSTQPTRWTYQPGPRGQIATLLGFAPAPARRGSGTRSPVMPTPPVTQVMPTPVMPVAPPVAPRGGWFAVWSRLVAWLRPRPATRPRHRRAAIKPLRER